jgi:UDPglucose 6-dehydrogenase
MKLAIVGSGYVGLVSGACLASAGHDVVCIDRDAARIEALQRGEVPIYEPGLDALLAEGRSNRRLSFTRDLASAVSGANAVFIAVGTPARLSDGRADLQAVFEAAAEIARAIGGFTVVVDKSTVPVGSADEVERIIREARPNADFAVVSNPEFLREGAAIADFRKPDRIVVGVEDQRARHVMAEIYRPFITEEAPLIFTRRRAAELIKYASNAFLAMKVTFINEIADLCEVVGVDVHEVERGVGSDRRIGPKFLRAGPGYGGSCFPKDTAALTLTAQEFGTSVRLVETTIAINEQRKRAMARKVVAACGGSVRDRPIGVLGLTFKPGTDDVRNSPAVALVQALQDAGAIVSAYDPKASRSVKAEIPGVAIMDDPYEAARGADALVSATDWDEFRSLDLARVKRLMRNPVLVDLRAVFDRKMAAQLNFVYSGVGQGEPGFIEAHAEAAE